jgi:hypothetical protein
VPCFSRKTVPQPLLPQPEPSAPPASVVPYKFPFLSKIRPA